MAQDYHITRSQDWTQNRGREISAPQWQSYAHNDSEFSSDPENGPNAFIWKAHPQESPDAWLDWSQGNVYSVDPDSTLISKMVHIAEALGARVVTDDNRVIEGVEDPA